ncbi:hypothetical protein H7J86_24490 [Mycobacterium hackensackense]|uniref:hypothetical protein n=1 Tax=Mycobacterium hackensackense TaxID=228909 RepID=UPI0022659FC9|nr:hypothetical protein [Mycobacterium hackensackense]MCV7255327.1 hypothetical protein [Mycobacterium hackensackense]
MTVDLTVGGPDVLPQRQVPAKGLSIPVTAKLSSDAVDKVIAHFKQAHPEIDTIADGCTCEHGPTRWGRGPETADTCADCGGLVPPPADRSISFAGQQAGIAAAGALEAFNGSPGLGRPEHPPLP